MQAHLTKLKAFLIVLFMIGGCTYSKTGPDTQKEGQISQDATTGQTTGPKLPDAPTGPTGETGSTGPTGETKWTQFLASNANDGPMAMALSPAGEIVIAGITDGSLKEGTPNAGMKDIFVAKFAAEGNLLWIDQRGTSGIDFAHDVAVDGQGNIYVTGYTEGPLDGVPNVAKSDVFLIKYDKDGKRLWTAVYGSQENDAGFSVAVDGQGTPWVVGHSAYGGLGGGDVYVWKFNPENGDHLESVQIGTDKFETAMSLVVEGENIIVAGHTEGAFQGQVSKGKTDVFLSFINTSVNPPTVTTIQPESNTAEVDMASRLASGGGKTYVSGWTYGGLFPGGSDVFVSEITTGEPPRIILATGGDEYVLGVAADSKGMIYVGGFTFGLFPNVSPEGLGQVDYYIGKYDFSTAPNPTPIWFHQDGTPEYDAAMDIAVDANGNVYVLGHTMGSLDGHAQVGQGDIFLRKYNSEGVLQ